MITIIFPYRNRELMRIKKSLDSLESQTDQNFRVFFIDYGSKIQFAKEVRNLVESYSFTEYFYSYNSNQPWSRSKAINIGLKLVKTPFVFIADIDIIFRNDFIKIISNLSDLDKAYYFKVGFLNEVESSLDKDFEDYSIDFSSGIGAQGLSLFNFKSVEKINGYDEFLHFWGAEDIDIHERLLRTGINSIFYNNEILLLHQWHKSYRKDEKDILSGDLQLKGVVRLNQQHLINNRKNETTVVNKKWGNPILEKEYNELEKFDFPIIVNNAIEVIDHFLFVELPQCKNKMLVVQFVEDPFQNSIKYKVKKLLGKNVPKYYSLKEINDMLLLHIVSFYHTHPYSYKVSENLKSITFKIKK